MAEDAKAWGIPIGCFIVGAIVGYLVRHFLIPAIVEPAWAKPIAQATRLEQGATKEKSDFVLERKFIGVAPGWGDVKEATTYMYGLAGFQRIQLMKDNTTKNIIFPIGYVYVFVYYKDKFVEMIYPSKQAVTIPT